MGGRVTLLITGAVLLASSYLLYDGKRAEMETRDQQNEYQFQGIARGNVESGLARGVSAIKRDLQDVETTFPRTTTDDGYYDLSIVKNLYGDLDVVVQANSGEADYQVDGNVIFTASLPAAFVVEDDVVEVNAAGTYQISGVDRRMDTTVPAAGYSNPVRGLITTEDHRAALAGELDSYRVVGKGSAPEDPVDQGSIIGGYDETDIEAFYQDAKSNATTTLSADPDGNVSETLFSSAAGNSSASNPAIIRAMGNLNLTSSVSGYGMLIVEDGDLNVLGGGLDWEGVVMVRKEWQDTVAVNLQNTTINGGFIAYDYELAPTLGLCVPDFTIDGDEAVVNEPFALRVEVLGAAIVSGEYDMPVTARVNVGGTAYEPWGSYDLALDGNVNTGNSGITYLWEPTEIFEAGSRIAIDARSWTRAEGTDGSLESHWSISMEENSSIEGPQIYLLKDDDPVPSVGGFQGQYSVAEFLDGYIENDMLTVDANQGVSLFELGVTDTGSEAFDLQDLVVMITMIDASQSGCVPGGGTSQLYVDIINSEIHYSSEAIAKLGLHLNTVREDIDVKITETAVQGTQEGEAGVYETGIEADDAEVEENTEGVTTVTVCHNGSEKTIPFAALAAYIGRGATMGTCPIGTTTTTVCHNNKTKVIPLSALPAHLGHGDTEGACQ